MTYSNFMAGRCRGCLVDLTGLGDSLLGLEEVEVKHQPPASPSSMSSSLRTQNSWGFQLTLKSTLHPNLMQVIKEREQAVREEIAKRKADIRHIEKQVVLLSRQIADVNDEVEAEHKGKEIASFSMMNGRHKEAIRSLESLRQATMSVMTKRKFVKVSLSLQEVSDVGSETMVVPLNDCLKKRLHLIGGCGHSRLDFHASSLPAPRRQCWTALSSSEKCDLDCDGLEFLSASSMSCARMHCAATVVEGKVCVLGGKGIDGNTALKTVERLCGSDRGQGSRMQEAVDARGWEVLRSCLRVGRYYCAAAAIDSFLCVVGGLTTDDVRLSSVERFNTKKGAWELLQPMSSTRNGCAAAVLQGNLCAIGGITGRANGETKASNSVERHDPDTNEWEMTPGMHDSRDCCAAATLDNKIYVMGGETESFESLSSVEFYEERSNEWRHAAPMNRSRSGHSAVVLHGLLYVFGGEDCEFSAEMHDPGRNTWIELESSVERGLRTGRTWHAAVVV